MYSVKLAEMEVLPVTLFLGTIGETMKTIGLILGVNVLKSLNSSIQTYLVILTFKEVFYGMNSLGLK